MQKVKIIYFYTFFFMGMWISKTVQPIYWNHQDVINFFGWSYAAMACTGILTFLYSKLIDQFGINKTVIFGAIFYSLGLFLRAYPLNLELAILSGSFSGIGAGSAMLAIRFWFLAYEDEQERQEIISYTSMINTFVQGFGVFISGWIVVMLQLFNLNGYKEALIIAAFLILFVVIYLPKEPENLEESAQKKRQKSVLKFILKNKRISFITGLCRFVSGFYITLIIPLLPLYLQEMDMKITNISLTLSIGLILSLMLQFLYGKKIPIKYLDFYYLIFSIGLGISVFTYFHDMTYETVAIISIILFSIFRAMTSMLFTSVELKIIPRESISYIFIITQTTFLLGEILGGSLSSYFYLNKYLIHYSWIVAIIIIINSYIFIYGIKNGRKKSP